MALKLFIDSSCPLPLFPYPAELGGSKAAQFRNEDGIKIFIRSVEFAPTRTKSAASE